MFRNVCIDENKIWKLLKKEIGNCFKLMVFFFRSSFHKLKTAFKLLELLAIEKKSSIYLLLFNNNCWGIFEVEIISRSHIINEGIKNIGNMFHGGHIQNWYGVWMFRVMRPHQWQGIGQKVSSGGSGLFLASAGSESCSSWCTTSGQGGQSCT